jgi:protein tyrosine/serine phosphatase
MVRPSPLRLGLLIAVLAWSAAPGCRNTARMAPNGPGDIAMSALRGDGSTVTDWAQPIAEPGLPNLHRVSAELYRSAQPDDTGLDGLVALGIRTVINARGDDRQRDALGRLAIGYEHMPMSAWSVRDADVVRFLRIVTDASRTPVLVHCEHGADRTGVLCAMYRVIVLGWAKDDAIAEMTRGGMGFNSLCGNLIDYVRDADVDQLRRAAGIAP